MEHPGEVITVAVDQTFWRVGYTEAVMVHSLESIPKYKSPVEIVRVRTEDLATRLNKAARSRQILTEHLGTDTPLRQYAALDGGEIVGWVRSIDTEGTTWCTNMYVVPEYRRRGIARAMMSGMLRDDRKHGSKLAVLTASHTGAHLYPLTGYTNIATLNFFTPKR